MLNVDDVDDACQELERCADLGLAGAFIPSTRSPSAIPPCQLRPLWWTAQDLEMPFAAARRDHAGGVPGSEFTIDINQLTAAGLANSDYWMRYSLTP
jgi:hypothetical protein